MNREKRDYLLATGYRWLLCLLLVVTPAGDADTVTKITEISGTGYRAYRVYRVYRGGGRCKLFLLSRSPLLCTCGGGACPLFPRSVVGQLAGRSLTVGTSDGQVSHIRTPGGELSTSLRDRDYLENN